MAGYEVLLCVCGGIAAYKTCEVASRLVQHGAGVTVAMTRSARRFVGMATYQALTGRRVLTSLWHRSSPEDGDHIGITNRADLIILAPATANIIGKMAGGIADDLVSTIALSADSPILIAPAMNDRMWEHPIVTENVRKLADIGIHMVGPDAGWLACRSVGAGRMSDADAIIPRAVELLVANPAKTTAASGVTKQ
ncbi:MAG: flavoprotein [Phycisphaerae bacterium]